MSDKTETKTAAPPPATTAVSVPKSAARSRAEEIRAQRRGRPDFGKGKMRLGAKIEPGFVGRWVNGDEARIAQLKERGYEFVDKPAAENNSDLGGSHQSVVVGSKADGSGRRDYLMQIPKEIYDEDQAAKQAQIDAKETAIRRKIPTNTGLAEGTSYVPKGHDNAVTHGDGPKS